MIINIREKIKEMNEEEINLLDNDLNKKPEILVTNLMGLYCGDNFSAEDVEQAIIEINLRSVNSPENWRLPKINEIKSNDRLFWTEEDPISEIKKSLFLVINI